MKANLKVALVHDYLVQYGGAEKTFEVLLEIFPQADIYTGIYEPAKMPEQIRTRRVFSCENGVLKRFPKYFTFLMPFVFEGFDLRKYDLIFSDGTAWPKGVLTTPGQMHISYIHTPPRFLYGYSVESPKRNKWYFKPFVTIIDFFLRIWDFSSAQRPNFLLTNSYETQKRIKKFYKRDATVIYPPVEVVDNMAHIKPDATILQKYGLTTYKYFLAFGRLAAYKNFDIAIQAFNEPELQNKILVIAGTGTTADRLKTLAGPNAVFTGKVSEAEKSALFKNCRAVLNLVEDEDFGIVPIEAMAFGKPVLAHKSGGHLETIEEGVSGLFLEKLDTGELVKKILEIDEMIANKAFNEQKIKDGVQKYSKERFRKEITTFVEQNVG